MGFDWVGRGHHDVCFLSPEARVDLSAGYPSGCSRGVGFRISDSEARWIFRNSLAFPSCIVCWGGSFSLASATLQSPTVDLKSAIITEQPASLFGGRRVVRFLLQ